MLDPSNPGAWSVHLGDVRDWSRPKANLTCSWPGAKTTVSSTDTLAGLVATARDEWGWKTLMPTTPWLCRLKWITNYPRDRQIRNVASVTGAFLLSLVAYRLCTYNRN